MLICSTLHIIDKVVIILTHHYGYLLKVLSGCMKASMDNALASMDLTSAQGHIMGYLAQRSQPPCSRDIEETFHLSHPTVSGLLSRLEKKDFIVLRPDETDRRDIEAQVVAGFSPEERELFTSMLLRAIDNMGASACIRKTKEESDT